MLRQVDVESCEKDDEELHLDGGCVRHMIELGACCKWPLGIEKLLNISTFDEQKPPSIETQTME